MGFTVAGADHYLVSGHRGADQANAPPNLGLIESTDGGMSWTASSCYYRPVAATLGRPVRRTSR